MKTTYLSLLVTAGTLLAVQAAEFRTDINPALLYYQSFLAAPEPISEADRNYLASKKGKEQPLPERFGHILASYDNQSRLLRQAAHSKVPCDWGIDLSPGPATALPHLARAKAAAQAAQWRAVWALQQGRQEDARDDLRAAFVLGRNAGSDKLFISALVQYVIEALNYATIAEHFGEFSPETLQQLVDGFDAAPARLTMAACIPSEKELGDWVRRKILELRKAYPNDEAKVMAAFRDAGYVSAIESVGEKNVWPRLLAASGGTSEGLLKLLRETDPLFPRLMELMALPPAEYEVKAKQFTQEIAQSPNPFVTAFGFLIDKWYQQGFRPTEYKAQAQQAMVRAAVAYKLNGEAAFKNVQDPFGDGPFNFRRFIFKGVDRGFEIKSAYAGKKAPLVMIFVEKKGPAFQVIGPDAGKEITEKSR